MQTDKHNFKIVENNSDLYHAFEELYFNQDYTCNDIKRILNIGNSKYQSLVEEFASKNCLRRKRGRSKYWNFLPLPPALQNQPTITQYNGVEED